MKNLILLIIIFCAATLSISEENNQQDLIKVDSEKILKLSEKVLRNKVRRVVMENFLAELKFREIKYTYKEFPGEKVKETLRVDYLKSRQQPNKKLTLETILYVEIAPEGNIQKSRTGYMHGKLWDGSK